MYKPKVYAQHTGFASNFGISGFNLVLYDYFRIKAGNLIWVNIKVNIQL